MFLKQRIVQAVVWLLAGAVLAVPPGTLWVGGSYLARSSAGNPLGGRLLFGS